MRSCSRARSIMAVASDADRRVPGWKLVTCCMPFMSGVTSITSVPLVRPVSRFCKFGSTCDCAAAAPSARAAAASRRGTIPRQLQFTCRSDFQQALGVAAQDLGAVLGSERHMLHPSHAGWIGHEGIVDREQDAIGAHLHHAAKQRGRREVAAGGDPEMLAEGVAKAAWTAAAFACIPR